MPHLTSFLSRRCGISSIPTFLDMWQCWWNTMKRLILSMKEHMFRFVN
jgi:hypothetical protein